MTADKDKKIIGCEYLAWRAPASRPLSPGRRTSNNKELGTSAPHARQKLLRRRESLHRKSHRTQQIFQPLPNRWIVAAEPTCRRNWEHLCVDRGCCRESDFWFELLAFSLVVDHSDHDPPRWHRNTSPTDIVCCKMIVRWTRVEHVDKGRSQGASLSVHAVEKRQD
jgi:hypothetical protein